MPALFGGGSAVRSNINGVCSLAKALGDEPRRARLVFDQEDPHRTTVPDYRLICLPCESITPANFLPLSSRSCTSNTDHVLAETHSSVRVGRNRLTRLTVRVMKSVCPAQH